jgi:cbb3-type cytochrome oxidase maturation protein
VSVLFVLIGISLLVAGGFLTAFLWSVNDGQYDDDYTPSVRILFDDTTGPALTASSKGSLNPNKEKTLNNKP